MTACTHQGWPLLTLVRAWYHSEPVWSPDVKEWDSLWVLIRKHGLDGMAGAMAAQGTRTPAAIRDKAWSAYCSNTLRYQQAEGVCREICRAALAETISLSVVKGPALKSAYGDDGVRGFGDIDVLVPDAPSAFKLAEVCGLSVRHGSVAPPSTFWKRARGIGRLEAVGRHALIEFTHGADAANQPIHDLYRKYRADLLLAPGSADPFPVPADHVHLAFLLQHLALHWLNRLIWLVDFAVIMRAGKYDPEWLERVAEVMQMRKLLRAVTRFCRQQIDASMPELGEGSATWKDGLYLSLLAPDTYSRSSLFKYGGGTFAKWIKDPVLGALQHVFATDMTCPAFSRRHVASGWTSAWLQYVMSPGGTVLARLTLPVTPFLYLVMVFLVCVVFRRSPLGFRRLARREVSDDGIAGFDLAKGKARL